MPVTSSSAPGTQALIGPPPGSIPVLAIGSFLLMAAVLYYVFFRFTFTYDYDGMLVVRSANPHQLVVTILEGRNLDGHRTSKWLATVQPLPLGAAARLTHKFGPKSSEIKNNVFCLPYRQSLRSLQVDVPVACKVRFTSAPLVEKIL